ncbi:MAG: ATP-binding cassette domain-containing protein [Clostridia bacterium]|nr:ATP-binding cassette domain-containing protein [Clostridia bacterium]
MLEIKDLTKHYGATKALCGFNYTFRDGIYALLGPNGSGKTTLMNLITDSIKRTSGSVLFNSAEITRSGASYREKIGYAPQFSGIYPNFTCEEYLAYIAVLKKVERGFAAGQIKELLSVFELYDVRGSKAKTLSGGMKQRLLLAQAFLGDPEIIVLDEPTAGLDPRQRIAVKNFVSQYASGKTVIYATHVVSDVENIARECIMLKNGRIAASGGTAEVAGIAGGKVWTCVFSEEPENGLPEDCAVVSRRGTGEGTEYRIVADEKPFPDCTAASPSLEDVYLYIFGREKAQNGDPA